MECRRRYTAGRDRLRDHVQHAVEVVDAPRIGAFAAHRNRSLGRRIHHLVDELLRHLAVVVVEVGELRIDAIVGNAGQRAGLVAK